jgi:hypothetical protein
MAADGAMEHSTYPFRSEASEMSTDNETERDFLNFSGITAAVAEVIRQARSRKARQNNA